jgi:hypothetical protein
VTRRRYSITVAGRVSDSVAAAFEPLDVVRVDGHTTIAGEALDQAALHGVLRKVELYALDLLTIETAPPGDG